MSGKLILNHDNALTPVQYYMISKIRVEDEVTYDMSRYHLCVVTLVCTFTPISGDLHNVIGPTPGVDRAGTGQTRSYVYFRRRPVINLTFLTVNGTIFPQFIN